MSKSYSGPVLLESSNEVAKVASLALQINTNTWVFSDSLLLVFHRRLVKTKAGKFQMLFPMSSINNNRKPTKNRPDGMTLFCWPTAGRSESIYNFDTWDDYADMGESVSETIWHFTRMMKKYQVVNIDLLDEEEIPFDMVDSY
ncbi:hypothetical protein JCM33374_g5143 [Metschnikowia sp. JCM 33374]|nr:hypothetical protein JCM33374_g5143 [Metschnikowia sp. JCM 33374]